MKCDYCEETNDNVVIIPKPKFFVWKEKYQPLIQAISDIQDYVCLNCLEFEMDETKNM
jgi:hypothetical protein